jgi:hypothetical protein
MNTCLTVFDPKTCNTFFDSLGDALNHYKGDPAMKTTPHAMAGYLIGISTALIIGKTGLLKIQRKDLRLFCVFALCSSISGVQGGVGVNYIDQFFINSLETTMLLFIKHICTFNLPVALVFLPLSGSFITWLSYEYLTLLGTDQALAVSLIFLVAALNI